MDSSELTQQVQANVIYSNYVLEAQALFDAPTIGANPLLNSTGLQALESARDLSVFQRTFRATSPPTPLSVLQGGITIRWSGGAGASVFTFTLNDAPSVPTILTGSSATWNNLASNATYTIVVTATNTAGSVTSDPLVVSTGSSPSFPPTAPASITQTATTSSGFTLAWLGGTGASSYTFTLDGSPVTPTVDPFAKTAAFTGLTVGTSYTVIITAVNSSGSTPSDPFIATTGGPPPDAPIDISQNATTTSGFTLSWLGATGATSYTFDLDGSPATPTVDLVAQTAVFTGLASSTSYSVTITATNENGSTPSSPFTATTDAEAPTAPDTISQTASSATGFTLAWSGATGATSYTFDLSGTPATPTVDLVAKTAVFTGLASSTSYSVTITAVNAGGSTPSSPFTATTGVPLPTAPTGISQSAPTATGFTLSWSGATGATSYTFDVSGSPATPTVNVGAKTAIFTGLASSTSYSVTITAVNASGSTPSSPFTATTGVPLPTAPTSISQTATTATGFTVAWTGATGATSYTATLNGSAASPTIDVGAKTAAFTGLTSSTSYTVVITAVNASGSTPSSPFTATTAVAPPTAPTSLSQTASPSTGFTVAWTGASGATSYTATLNGSAASPTVDVSAKTAAFTGLTSSTSYTVIITAVNVSGSAPSSPFTATTGVPPPTAPTSLSATSITSSGFTLGWSGGTGATSYTFTLNGSAASPTVNVGAKTAIFTGLTASTLYALIATAVNVNGSTPSSSYPVTTLDPPPTTPVVTVSSRELTSFAITWTGGATATSYSFVSGVTTYTPTTVGTNTATLSGLTIATLYTFVFNAINASGTTASAPFNVQLYGATSVLATGLTSANDVFVDLSQNILVANTGANSIRLITPSGTVSTVSAALNQPYGVTTDTSAFMYVTNTNNNAISKLTYAGVVTTFVSLTQPRCIRMDGSGNLYLVSFVGNSQFIIQINPSGGQTNVISGLTNPSSLFVDAAKNIYIPTTNTTTVLTKYSESGGTWSPSATYTFSSSIRGVAVNAAGYIAVSLGNNTVQIRTPSGVISTVTGFSAPNGLCFNSSGTLYVSDTTNSRVIAITIPP